jgi:DNA ligase (NAD+)
MTDLFGREPTAITKHLRNTFRQGELDPKSVRAKFAHTAGDRKVYQVDYLNLDAVLSVGYRVNSKRERLLATHW